MTSPVHSVWWFPAKKRQWFVQGPNLLLWTLFSSCWVKRSAFEVDKKMWALCFLSLLAVFSSEWSSAKNKELGSLYLWQLARKVTVMVLIFGLLFFFMFFARTSILKTGMNWRISCHNQMRFKVRSSWRLDKVTHHQQCLSTTQSSGTAQIRSGSASNQNPNGNLCALVWFFGNTPLHVLKF